MRLALLCAMLAAVPALAQTPTPAAPAAPGQPPASDPYWQQTICRKDKETGSLIKGRKTCHTRQQWAYIDDTNQDFTRRMMDDYRTRQSGN